jgi:hypothetical protein
MHAKGSGAVGTFTATYDVTRYTKARIFSEIGKQTPMFARYSTVAGERGAADAERDIISGHFEIPAKSASRPLHQPGQVFPLERCGCRGAASRTSRQPALRAQSSDGKIDEGP